MDIPGISDSAATTSSDNSAAAIDVNSLLGTTDDSTTTTDDNTTDNAADDSASNPIAIDGLIPNDTVETNDMSVVGDVKPEEEKPTVLPFELAPTPPQSAPVEEPKVEESAFPVGVAMSNQPATPAEPDDPEKLDFIKTYTAEFDATLARATGAAQKVLDAIDEAIHDKSADISVPEEANEFLDSSPEDGKVQKFEDARDVVRAIMTHAAEAKKQSEAAATEAARIYDEVQAFKKETQEQIAELTNDEE